MSPQQEAIEQFVDQLIKDAGLDAMDPNFLSDYKEQLIMTLMQRVGLEVLNRLNDREREEAVSFMETNPTREEIDEFYRKGIPHLEELTKNLMEGFRTDFLKKSQTLNRTP